MIQAILIVSMLLLIAVAVAVFLGKRSHSLKKELTRSRASIELLRHNVTILGKHIHKIEDIYGTESRYKEKLSTAEDDAAVYAIMGSIAKRNNDKLLNSSGGAADSASTNAGKRDN